MSVRCSIGAIADADRFSAAICHGADTAEKSLGQLSIVIIGETAAFSSAISGKSSNEAVVVGWLTSVART